MANGARGEDLSIGNALKEARQRAGLDIRTVEERTKIRTRYLRALESEEWAVLPGHAYVKGFLRTYANLLSLDGDALVDEYRRTVEGPGASPVPLAGGVLQARRGDPGEPRRGPGLGTAILAALGLVAVVLLVLGLTAGDDDPAPDPAAERGERQERQADARAERRRERRRQQRRAERRQEASERTVSLRLVPQVDGLTVCLLGDGQRPLIDGQTLSVGNDESFEARRFELRFPFGYDVDQLDLRVGGRRADLPELSGPAAFRISPPRTVRQIEFPGRTCP